VERALDLCAAAARARTVPRGTAGSGIRRAGDAASGEIRDPALNARHTSERGPRGPARSELGVFHVERPESPSTAPNRTRGKGTESNRPSAITTPRDSDLWVGEKVFHVEQNFPLAPGTRPEHVPCGTLPFLRGQHKSKSAESTPNNRTAPDRDHTIAGSRPPSKHGVPRGTHPRDSAASEQVPARGSPIPPSRSPAFESYARKIALSLRAE
jgi:hypothetical protein